MNLAARDTDSSFTEAQGTRRKPPAAHRTVRRPAQRRPSSGCAYGALCKVCSSGLVPDMRRAHMHGESFDDHYLRNVFAHHVHNIMTEGEPFSERKKSLDDTSSRILRGDGEAAISLVSAEVVSTLLPATGSEHEVTGPASQVSQTEQPGTCDVDINDSKRGVKRSREIEPMDHSGRKKVV